MKFCTHIFKSMVLIIEYFFLKKKSNIDEKMGHFHLHSLLQSSIPLLKVVYMTGM